MTKFTVARYVGYALLIVSIVLLAVPQAALAQTVPNPETPVQAAPTQDDGPDQGTPAQEKPAVEPAQTVTTPPDEVTIQQTDDPNVIRTTRRIYVSEDSYISSGYSNANFGAASDLNLGWDNAGPNAMRMLIKFDIGGIPHNAVIRSARLSIYQYTVVPANDGNMDFKAQFMRQDWSEGGVTWNNANYLGGDQLPFGSIPPFFGYITGDATNLVKSWVSGQQPNYGLLITGDEVPSRNRSRRFYSRETGSPPFIDVEYDVHCDTTPPVATVAPLPSYEPSLFLVKWSGQDYAPAGCAPSGIANYDVEYRINGGNWTHWKKQTTATENHFKHYAPDRSFVELRARATDNAGNVGVYNGPYASTTIDASPPTATMNQLPQFTASPNFTVSWSGDDRGGSGVRSYSVQFRVVTGDGNEGPWEMLIENTPQTSYQITGAQEFSAYEFRVQATDNVDNVSAWPSDPQTYTIIFFQPIAAVEDFDPPVLKPTAPVTDRFTVRWDGITPPGTTITQFTIYYSYNGGSMQVWKTFPGTQTSADFPYKQLGYGDGIFAFNAKATNDQGQTGDFVLPPATIAVDMADAIHPIAYLPILGATE
jgi:hypothetical protein